MNLLNGLPLEVLLNVTSFLDTPDYGNLRRTCSTIEKALFDAFAKEFFSIRQFMMTSFSLQVLLDIADHPTLSSYLNKVIIGLDIIVRPPVSNDSALSRKTEIWQDYLQFLDTGALTGVLAMALRKLPNCKAVEIRDFASNTKRRDDGSWRSYGVKTIQAAGGVVTFHHPLSTAGPHSSLVFNQVIMAIAQSGMHFQSLGLIVRSDENAVKCPAFYVPPWFKVEMAQSFVALQSFAIAVKIPSDLSGFDSFLLQMPNLSNLRINGLIRAYQLHSEQSLFSSISSVFPSMTKIRRFEIGKFNTSTTKLTDLISSLPHSIEDLVFYRLRLYREDDRSWDSIIHSLKALPSLKSVSLRILGQSATKISSSSEIHFDTKLYEVHFKPFAGSDDKPETLKAEVSCDSRVRSIGEELDNIRSRVLVKGREWMKKYIAQELDDSEENDISNEEDGIEIQPADEFDSEVQSESDEDM